MIYQMTPIWFFLLCILTLIICGYLEYRTRKLSVQPGAKPSLVPYIDIDDPEGYEELRNVFQCRLDAAQRRVESKFFQHPQHARVQGTLQCCKTTLGPEAFKLLLQMEEELMQLTVIEKERIYLEGVKDGMEELKSLTNFST